MRRLSTPPPHGPPAGGFPRAKGLSIDRRSRAGGPLFRKGNQPLPLLLGQIHLLEDDQQPLPGDHVIPVDAQRRKVACGDARPAEGDLPAGDLPIVDLHEFLRKGSHVLTPR